MIQIKTPAASLTFNQSGGWYKGEDGYTPVKGVDYWTQQDKQEIINELEDLEEIHVGDEPDADSDALVWIIPDDTLSFDVDDYYTKTEVDYKLAQAALDGAVDLSTYVQYTDLENYVQKTTIGSNTALGLVKTLANGTAYGVNINSAGNLSIVGANATDIANKSHAYKPLTPNNLDYAIEIGLTTNNRTLSAEKQAAAKAWLGIKENSGETNVDLSNYYTKSEVEALIPTLPDMSAYALKSQIPDVSGFALKADIPDVSVFTTMGAVEAKGYQTAAQVTAAINSALGVIENGTY